MTSNMKYRDLGTTGLRVSEIGLGTWAFGGDEWGPSDDDRAIATIHRGLDLGINLLDTADVYGYGHSEEIIRQALESRPERVLVCSKAGNDIYNTPQIAGGGPKDFSPEYLERAVEGSLARLGLEALDIYLLHNPSLDVLREGSAMATLHRLKDAGKIRFVGASIYTAEEGRAAIDTGRAHVLMIPYNLIAQAEGKELFPYASSHGVGILARSPLANGLLTGKYTPESEFSPDEYRAQKGREWLVQNATRAARYRFLTRDGERSLPQAALAFILSNPDVAGVVVGAKSPVQIEDNVRAAACAPLSMEELARIDAVETRSGSE